MKKLLLRALLSEYLNQLSAGFDSAQKQLQPRAEPTKRRAWKNSFPIRFDNPTENTPEDEWIWIENHQRQPQHPALAELAEAIGRFGEFVELLEGKTE